jgi:hypothetical protein
MSKLIQISDHDSSGEFVPSGMSKGLIPRDFGNYPIGYLAAAKPMPSNIIIPKSEWKDRLALQKKYSTRLIDIRNRGMDGRPIPSRDQNGKGYCWAHSSCSTGLLARAAMNEPYADLSAYSIAATIKNYRDEGGWNAQSIKFMVERGCATSKTWPQKSMDRSLKDNPKVWEDAAHYKITEWYDLEGLDQFVTACLLGWPIASDFNWWGHSVATMCLEEVGDRVEDLVTWILNSWGDKWSQNGAGMLKGKKALPNSMIAAVVHYASAA